MRTVKEPEERKAEILDVAERLFTTKGYNKTTISDILDEIGVARGTFYYHFKSKEEVMDAIIMRFINATAAAARSIADDERLSVLEKIFKILFASKVKSGDEKEKILEQLHQAENAEMHQKSLVAAVLHLSPILARVVEQGIEEKIMSVEYPKETVEFLLACAQVIFDDGLFQWEPDEAARKIKAFINMMEAAVGTEKGYFTGMANILAQ